MVLTYAERLMVQKLLEHGTVKEVNGTITIGGIERNWELYRVEPTYFRDGITYRAAIGYELKPCDTAADALDALEGMAAHLQEVTGCIGSENLVTV